MANETMQLPPLSRLDMRQGETGMMGGLAEALAKRKANAEKGTVESAGKGEKIESKLAIVDEGGKEDGYHFVVIAPGSGTGLGLNSKNRFILDVMRQHGKVSLVQLKNKATDEFLEEETAEQLTQTGEELYSWMLTASVDFVYAGSRGGYIAAKVIERSGEDNSLTQVRYIVKNAFEPDPRGWLANMPSKSPNALLLLTSETDYMNRDLNETKAFFASNWGGNVFYYHEIGPKTKGHVLNLPAWLLLLFVQSAILTGCVVAPPLKQLG